jgi:N-acetylmuramoyl-L-alanine amidase
MRRRRPALLVLHAGRLLHAGLLAGAIALAAWAGSRAAAAIHLAFAVASLRGRVVAIDPGHGGIDPGALGPHGVHEDAVTLAVSLDLAGLLRRAGAQAVLTRQGEPRGPAGSRARLNLRSRMAFINSSGADVLVSVHANAYPSAAEHGAQVFYDADHLDESRQLALLIQAQLAALTATRRSASRHIGHYLLEHAGMPAVTVEVGFLSNPREARLLADPAYQRRLAYAIFVGLAYWFSERHAPAPAAGAGAG